MLRAQPNLLFAGVMAYLTFLTFVPILLLATSLHHSEMFFLFILTFGLTLFGFIAPYRKRARLLSAADQGLITQEQGEITWQNNAYVARTPTRQLTTIGALSLPPPGPYHFYYLTDSSILLSADPIRTSTGMIAYPGTLAALGLSGQEQARLALQQALCHALNFTLHDLDCNRMRTLSYEQRRHLSRKFFWRIIGSLVSLPIGVAVLLWAFALSTASASPLDPVTIFVFLFGGGILLTALYHLTLGAYARVREIRRADFLVITGIVTPRRVSGGEDADSYFYDINSISIPVSERAYDALIPNTSYRLFYLPRMQTILSIEPLGAPPR